MQGGPLRASAATGARRATSSGSARSNAGYGEGGGGRTVPGRSRSVRLVRPDRHRRRSRRHSVGGACDQSVAAAFSPSASSDPSGLASSSVELRSRRAHGRASLLRGVRRSRVDPGRGARRHPGRGDARRPHRRGGTPIRIAGRRPGRAHLRRSRSRVIARRRRDRGPAGLGDKSGHGLANELGRRSLRRRRRTLPRSRLRHGSLGSHGIRVLHARPVPSALA